MRDPELRSPAEWAEDLRDETELIPMDDITPCTPFARVLTDTDCRELADRMDDLSGALRLLRVWLGSEPWKPAMREAAETLAKYQED